MSNIVLANSKNITSLESKIIINSKEWPFDGYLNEIKRLEQHFGQRLLFSTKERNGVNSLGYTPMGLFLINPEYIHPEQRDPLYPHSVVLSNGNAINMKEIILIGIYEKLNPPPNSGKKSIIIGLCPWMTVATGRVNNLKILNSEDVIYRNLLLYKSLMKDSKKSQDDITKMVKESSDRYGDFD